jgi:hypothetical protein
MLIGDLLNELRLRQQLRRHIHSSIPNRFDTVASLKARIGRWQASASGFFGLYAGKLQQRAGQSGLALAIKKRARGAEGCPGLSK